jgi:hypothetical protein
MAPKLSELMAMDRRLLILRFLSEADGYALNTSLIAAAVREMGHNQGRDIIDADVVLLEQHGLLAVERIDVPSGVVMVAELTRLGLDVSRGRPHPLVRRPGPEN